MILIKNVAAILDSKTYKEKVNNHHKRFNYFLM